MKRALLGLLTAVLVCEASAMSVSAAGGHHGHGGYRGGLCCESYADENCDGICDSCGECGSYRGDKICRSGRTNRGGVNCKNSGSCRRGAASQGNHRAGRCHR